MTHRTRAYFLAAILVAALVAALLLRIFIFPAGADEVLAWTYEPVGIMGTETKLTVYDTARRADSAGEALLNATYALRRVEALMSTRLAHSELAIFNRAPVGEPTELAPELIALLRTSRQLAEDSDGAFDVTVGPLIELWKRAGQAKQLPTDTQIAAAMAQCGWAHIELREGEAVRLADNAAVDLGGIAKGYGIDQAVEAMRRAGCSAGVVDVGGDVRFFGRKPNGRPWTFRVRNPFGPGFIGTFEMDAGSVCTSGNYQRFSIIDGRRYSHIIDPRTGRPTEAAPSVTVTAPTAAVADGWATALSVLGPDGLKYLPDGAEAMIVIGTPDDHEIITTPGFPRRLEPSGEDE